MMASSLLPSNKTGSLVNQTIHVQLYGRNRVDYVMISVSCLLGFIAFTSNSLVCTVICRKRSLLRKPYNVIICALAVCDLLAGLSLLLVSVLQTFFASLLYDHEDSILWQAVLERGWFELTFGKVSLLLVMCLAVERWFAVCKPITYRRVSSKRRVNIYLIPTVIIPICCNLQELFPNYDYQNDLSKILVILEVILTTFLPLLVTWATYAHLFHRLKTPSTLRPTRSSSRNVKKKLLRMCSLTAVFMTICWLPEEIMFFVDLWITVPPQYYDDLSKVLYIQAMSHSIVNPCIYFFFSTEYKKELRKSFH